MFAGILIERESEILVLGCKNSVIKNGVKKIGSHAFYYATGLKSIVIPDSVDLSLLKTPCPNS